MEIGRKAYQEFSKGNKKRRTDKLKLENKRKAYRKFERKIQVRAYLNVQWK
jgi:hypothetical protein